MKLNGVRSILIIKLSALGDVVHTLPALEVLKNNYPKARIDWLVEEEAFPIVEGHRSLDQIIVSKRKKWVRGLAKRGGQGRVLRDVKVFLSQLRSRKYDLVIDFQGLLKSGLLVWLTKGVHKVGMTGSREASRLFLNHKAIQVSYNQHAIERYLQICSSLGCEDMRWEGKIPYKKQHAEAVRKVLYEKGYDGSPIIVISPMARWQTKLWRKEAFGELADKIQILLGYTVVFTGSSDDQSYIDDILGSMKSRALSTAGCIGLKELSCLFEMAEAAVTTDTGPMHIAAAMGCPVVALFGPTDPKRTGPYGLSHKIIRSGIQCSPCFRKQCSDPRCMSQIKTEEVFKSLKEILK